MTAAPILDSLESLHAAVDDFLKHAATGGMNALDDDEFFFVAREIATLGRRLRTADYPVIDEIELRDLPDKHLTRNAAGMLSALWRITPHEASARVREAQQLSTRTAVSGEVLEPLRPVAAAARNNGVLGDEHVRVILKALDALPRELPVEDMSAAEQILVEAAHALNPLDLNKIARRLHDTIDPDGPEPSEEHHARRRDATFREEWDGMIRATMLLDPATGAKARAFVDAHSAPRSTDTSGRDDRTPGQRRHDAMAQLFDLGLRAGEHATATGSPATVLITMTAEQFESGTGYATTSQGQRIRVDESLRLADQASIAWVVHGSRGGIVNYGRSRRLASKGQAEALAARDGGCAFPGCRLPAEWCERHHIVEWRKGGLTALWNLVLLCKYHHDRHIEQGWRIEIRDDVPWFIPPKYIDPTQTPLRNLRGAGVSV